MTTTIEDELTGSTGSSTRSRTRARAPRRSRSTFDGSVAPIDAQNEVQTNVRQIEGKLPDAVQQAGRAGDQVDLLDPPRRRARLARRQALAGRARRHPHRDGRGRGAARRGRRRHQRLRLGLCDAHLARSAGARPLRADAVRRDLRRRGAEHHGLGRVARRAPHGEGAGIHRDDDGAEPAQDRHRLREHPAQDRRERRRGQPRRRRAGRDRAAELRPGLALRRPAGGGLRGEPRGGRQRRRHRRRGSRHPRPARARAALGGRVPHRARHLALRRGLDRQGRTTR